MAMYSSDGVGHHSASRAKMHEEKIAPAGKPKSSAPKPAAPKASSAGPTHEAPSAHSIEDHVAQHGPAVEIHHKHDKATGKHHITSHHGETGGEKHTSDHETPESAIDRMKKALGMQSPDDADQNELGTTPDQEVAEGTQGAGIPGLSR